MNIKIRTQNSQRVLKANSFEELNSKIKDIFKIDEYILYFDIERTIPLKEVVDNQTIYLEYKSDGPKVYKEEFKCTHSADAVCSRCASLDPFEKSTEKKSVKYLSYKSYLELLDSKNKQKEVFDYTKRICNDHGPNVKCSKCMDKQISLMPQMFRHIDYVEFDNKACIDNFIGSWRSSGRQKIGLLLGRYEDYDLIPEGRKVVVSAIWEIEQDSYPDGSCLKNIRKSFITDKLSILGVIYTSINQKDGHLHSNKRENNYIISTSEIKLIDALKKEYNNEAFIGICVDLDQANNITPEVFMVTEQFSALSEHLIMTTKPDLFYTKKPIMYNYMNDQKIVVSKQVEDYVPIDYFVVNCPIGFKENPIFENTTMMKMPTPRKLAKYFQFNYKFEKFKNFQILVVLEQFIPKNIKNIFDCILENDEIKFERVLDDQEMVDFLKSLEQYSEEKVSPWNCEACTFFNEKNSSICEICNTPRIN